MIGLILLATFVPQDQNYKEFAENIKLDQKEINKWKDDSKELIDLLTSKESWQKWAKQIYEMQGTFQKDAVIVSLKSGLGVPARTGLYKNGKRFIDIDAALFKSHPREEMEEVLIHELSHAMFYSHIGSNKAKQVPAWFREGLAQYTARQTRFFRHVEKVERIDKQFVNDRPSNASEYGRASLFFEFLATEYDGELIKKVLEEIRKSTSVNYKKTLELLTKESFNKLIEREKEWSAKKVKDVIDGNDSKEPNYDEFANKLSIDKDEVDNWSNKAKNIIDLITSKENKTKWACQIYEKIGSMKIMPVQFSLIDNKDGSSVQFESAKDKHMVKINIAKTAKYSKEITEELILNQLCHLVLSDYLTAEKLSKLPQWLVRGLCLYCANQTRFVKNVDKLDKIDKQFEKSAPTSMADYGRAILFFEFMASEFGAKTIKNFIETVHKNKKVDCKEALEKTTKLSWNELMEKELDWSKERTKNKK